MDRVNKSHSMVGHYRIKMCAAFMTSSLKAGATLVERNPGYSLFWIIAGRSLTLIKCTPGICHLWFWFIYFVRFVVSVVDLDEGSWVFFNNLLLRCCDFFPRKLGCDAFPGTTICRVTASFHNFIFFTYFSIYYFNFICFPFWSTCQRCQVLMEPTFPKVIYQSLNLTLIFSAANISVIYVIQKIIVEISSI